jgi:hypothetical protein
MAEVVPAGLFILALTFFLDLLELSFGRILWFVRTLRFWLYFILHFGISCLAAYLVHTKIDEWYLLAPAGTFLGVSVISNTNIKIGGQSLVPIADLFQSIRAKMLEQAGNDKAEEVGKADLAARLRKLPVNSLENAYRNLLAAGGDPERVEDRLKKARERVRGSEESNKTILISYLLKTNSAYVAKNIDSWDPPATAPAVPTLKVGS